MKGSKFLTWVRGKGFCQCHPVFEKPDSTEIECSTLGSFRMMGGGNDNHNGDDDDGDVDDDDD